MAYWVVKAQETRLSFSSELIKQPILELSVTGAKIFVEHIGRNQLRKNTFENHSIVNMCEFCAIVA